MFNRYHKMISVKITPQTYQAATPFPHGVCDGFLPAEAALSLQKEILELPAEAWDRYDNPFEQKYTLRDKHAFPPHLASLFATFESPGFVADLSRIVGEELYLDTTRNFWGVHIYKSGDYLDIHTDAGYHPTLGLKKQVTLGLYLSYEWDPSYGCELEIWEGGCCASNNPHLVRKVETITPVFNRMILFTCNDFAWHGNPVPSSGPPESRRIFVTISYLSKNYSDLNKRVKAFFVARPSDPEDPEKDRLRLLRADPEKYKEIYKI